MKMKFIGIAAAVLSIISMSACSSKDTVTTDATVLPDAAMSVIKANYQDVKVSQIKIDKELSGDDYDVILSNGTKMEFASDGSLQEVKAAQNDSVPASLVPEKVMSYITENHADQKVVKIEFSSKKTEVTLSSGMELEFDAQGNFMKIDD